MDPPTAIARIPISENETIGRKRERAINVNYDANANL